MLLANLSRLTLLLVIYLIRVSNGYSTTVASLKRINNASNFTVLILCTKSKYYCTGSIVDFSWVLTTATCLYDENGKQTEDTTSLLVVAGSRGINQAKADIKSGRAQIRSSKNIIKFDTFEWDLKISNDIALVELSEPFKKSDTVAVANFNKSDEKQVEVEVADGNQLFLPCEAIGYGGGKELKGQQFLTSKACPCLDLVRSHYSPVNIKRPKNKFLCNKAQEDSKNSMCEGDNGAPLMCQGFFRGFISSMLQYKNLEKCKSPDFDDDVKCGNAQTLRIFMDVCYFREWLSANIPNFLKPNEWCNEVIMLS